VKRWTCPACGREFGAPRQAHTCVPGCSVEESFAGRPAGQRAVYDAVVAHLESVGPVHVDPVRVGVFLRRRRKVAEVRPRARSVALALMLPRRLVHPRVSRQVRVSADRIMHVIPLTRAEEVDEELRGWLTEAYVAAGD
jgi:hypothetical protein